MRPHLKTRLRQRADVVQALLVRHEDSNAMLVVDAELRLLETEEWDRELGACWERSEDERDHGAETRLLPQAHADYRPAMMITCVLRSGPANKG